MNKKTVTLSSPVERSGTTGICLEKLNRHLNEKLWSFETVALLLYACQNIQLCLKFFKVMYIGFIQLCILNFSVLFIEFFLSVKFDIRHAQQL